MSRTKRFIAGTLTGYGSIAANVIFTLISVPLALSYLDKEQFGLWALAAQINGYLCLLDLGMGNATNRFIADHKDHINGGDYGSHLITSALVYIIQGMVMMIGGLGLAIIGPELLAIPNDLVWEFRMSILLLAINSGLSIASKAMGSALWAFQRTDVINICFTIISLSGLGFLWLGFTMNLGLLALPIALYPGTLIVALLYYVVSKRNGYFPCKGNWGRPCTKTFKRMFNYGKDSFMIQLGNQLVNASQIIIISRFIGLGAAATYAVGTKVYMLARMLLSTPITSANPILTELYVRNEPVKFQKHFRLILSISIASAFIVSGCIAAINTEFVSLWSMGEVSWHWSYDFILALTLLTRSYSTTLHSLFSITKNLQAIRLSPLFEGLVFVALASILSLHYGVLGVLLSALAAQLLCGTLWFSRCSKTLIGKTTPTYISLIAMLTVIVVATAPSALGLFTDVHPAFSMLAVIPALLLTGFTAWVYVLDEPTRSELKKHTFLLLDSANVTLRKKI